MAVLVCVVLLLCLSFSTILTWDLLDKARINIDRSDGIFKRFSLGSSHSRVELLPGPQNGRIYIGGNHKLFLVNYQTSQPQQIQQADLSFNVTSMHALGGGSFLFLCGTDGNPKCCNMSSEHLGECMHTHDTPGMAPFSVNDPGLALFVDDELYTTVIHRPNGRSLGIRRGMGPQGYVWSNPSKTDQIYVRLALSGPREDHLQDKLYTFMMETNVDEHPEADLWVPRVSQVCRSDRGGPRIMLEKKWTTQLIATLSCGVPSEKLYFTRLKDVAIVPADDWKRNRVYALFNNRWNHSAVCVYTMGDIDNIFRTSAFKEREDIPNPRPGTCVEDSRKLTIPVLHPMLHPMVMEQWVVPENNSTPLMISSQWYQRLCVDEVTDRNGKQDTILLLTLDSGRIHEVMVRQGQAFVQAELQPFAEPTKIHSILLRADTGQKKLYLSTISEVVEIDMSFCSDCGWTADQRCYWNKCVYSSSPKVYNAKRGYNTSQDTQHKAEVIRASQPTQVPLHSRYYLLCSGRSTYANYTWYHNGQAKGCIGTDTQCVLLIDKMDTEHEGHYRCEATEGRWRGTVAVEELRLASVTGPRTCSSVLVAVTFLLAHLL